MMAAWFVVIEYRLHISTGDTLNLPACLAGLRHLGAKECDKMEKRAGARFSFGAPEGTC